MITEEDIREAIEHCTWRKDVGGVSVCAGDLAPCMRLIDGGKCDTLKRLFAESGENDG